MENVVPPQRIRFLPVSFFSMIMGLTGFTIVLQKVEPLLSAPEFLSWGMLVFTSALFVLLTILYGIKIVSHWDEVLREFGHVTRMAFFPTFSISLLLLSVAWHPVSAPVSLALWAPGAAIHFVFTLAILGIWIRQTKFEVHHMSPAWFIPVVGNILVPIAGVLHAPPEVSWFFFSVGLVFWVILFSLFFYRIVFHHPLPEKLLPTLFILIAPPAVGTIAYLRLVGEVNDFTRVLYFTALFLFLLLVSQASLFRRVKFFLSWWAYSFPWAALTIASLALHHQTGALGYQIIGGALAVGLLALVLVLMVRTAVAVAQKRICVQED